MERVTRELFHNLVRKKVLEERVHVDAHTAIQLAAYNMQISKGDYHPDLYQSMNERKVFSKSVCNQFIMNHIAWRDELQRRHKKLEGIMTDDALIGYINTCHEAEGFSTTHYRTQSEHGDDLWLGINAVGLSLYAQHDKRTPLTHTPWEDISAFSYERTKIVMELKTELPPKLVIHVRELVDSESILE
eukprot:Colp12_sorted_trinity150504_noHs@3730